MKFDDKLFQRVADILALGIQDGSIRKDIDPKKGTFSIIFMSTGFFRLLSKTGENYADHLNLDLEEFSEYTLQLFLESVKPKME